MNLFQEQFEFIDTRLKEHSSHNQLKILPYRPHLKWPSGGQRNLIIGRDIAVELGHPEDASVSFILWEDAAIEKPGGEIYLVGPDLPESTGARLPFAKIVMLRGNGFSAENAYERFVQLEAVKYNIDLKGYMMRSVPQVNLEWSRVSHQAIQNGFGFRILGGALIDAFSAFEYIHSVSVLFVTLSRVDVTAFQPLTERVRQVTAAMNKMNTEINLDCENCSYADVCDEVAGLRAMRSVMEHRNG